MRAPYREETVYWNLQCTHNKTLKYKYIDLGISNFRGRDIKTVEINFLFCNTLYIHMRWNWVIQSYVCYVAVYIIKENVALTQSVTLKFGNCIEKVLVRTPASIHLCAFIWFDGLKLIVQVISSYNVQTYCYVSPSVCINFIGT